MSLQTYDINIGLTKTQEVSAQGRYLYYYDGTTPNITAGTALATSKNQQIKVTAGTTGASVLLMPGQSIRLAPSEKSPSMWKVTNANGVEVITGSLLIGEGDFHDSNVSNTIKLDATFANNVKVTNDATARVPVTLDTSQSIGISNTTANRVPVTLDTNQTLNVAGNIMAYTSAYSGNASSAANTAIQMLAAGANVNGAVLNRFDVITNNSCNLTVLAKATAPVSLTDGDVLFSGVAGASATRLSLDVGRDGQPKVAAGKAIWYISNAADSSGMRSALFTVL